MVSPLSSACRCCRGDAGVDGVIGDLGKTERERLQEAEHAVEQREVKKGCG